MLANSKIYFRVTGPALDEEFIAKFKILLDGYRKMFDQGLSKSKELGDMRRFLPGVVAQKPMSMQGMADLYRIEPDLLEYFNNSNMGTLRGDPTGPFRHDKILDDYLSVFLQDRDRSQHYYCDPMLQHIFICRHFLAFLPDGLTGGSNALDLQS